LKERLKDPGGEIGLLSKCTLNKLFACRELSENPMKKVITNGEKLPSSIKTDSIDPRADWKYKIQRT
jgi:hypothetical protein